MRKTGYYGILESQECTKWWNVPPALRISRFISNSSAQPGKLIKGCSQACTERAATAQGGFCCFVWAARRDFVLFHSLVPVPPPRRGQSVPTPISSPRWRVPCWALCHRGRVTDTRAPCEWEALGAVASPERHMIHVWVVHTDYNCGQLLCWCNVPSFRE